MAVARMQQAKTISPRRAGDGSKEDGLSSSEGQGGEVTYHLCNRKASP